MFKKLLSNLPFNPSLIAQVSFYTRRMKRESAIRRTGLIFIVLTMFVQFFAVVSPPQATLASSDNDIIPGGVNSKQEAADWCNTNLEIRVIFAHFGVSCAAVAAGSEGTVRSTDFNRNLYSLGRKPYGKAGETTVPIGAQNFYLRYLWSWDTGAYSTYQAVYGIRADGTPFMILFDCGNLVIVGLPTAPAPTPPAPTPKPTPPTATPTQPPAPRPSAPAPRPLPPPPPPVIPPQELSCSNLVMSVSNNAVVKLGTQLVLRGQASGQNIKSGQKVDMYYDYVDAATNKTLDTSKSTGISFSGTTANDSQSHTFSADTPGEFIFRLTVKYDSSKTASGSATGNCLKRISVDKACEAAQSGQDLEACVELHKKARNITQNISNANDTTANPGDIIEYTISATNTGNVTVSDFVFKESISDILDYGDVLDLKGGLQDERRIVTWPAQNINAGQTVARLFTVKIKDIIPSTPVSASDPGHFDLKITNVYGDTININLPPSAPKIVETVVTTLPKTGPGTSLIIGFVLTSAVGYFFARSKLFAVELDMVREDFVTSGGM